jgi:hypothetical protein
MRISQRSRDLAASAMQKCNDIPSVSKSTRESVTLQGRLEFQYLGIDGRAASGAETLRQVAEAELENSDASMPRTKCHVSTRHWIHYDMGSRSESRQVGNKGPIRDDTEMRIPCGEKERNTAG